jgi:hypothetical protein
MACSLLLFSTKSCRLTFRVFRFAKRGAILTGKRRGKKWVDIAAGLMGGGRWKSQRMQAGGRVLVGDECAKVWDLGWNMEAATITIFVNSRTQHPVPPELLTSETSNPRTGGSRAGLGQLCCWEFGDKILGIENWDSHLALGWIKISCIQRYYICCQPNVIAA